MVSEKNITMRQYNVVYYDTLYPKTIASQIPDVYSKTDTITAETLSRFGLSADKLPNDAFQQIKTLIDNVQSSTDSKAKIQTGSYVGTGTYGVNHPNQIVLPFPPQFFAIIPVTGSSNNHHAVIGIPGALSLRYNAYSGFSDYYIATEIEAIGNVLQWYTATNAVDQLNYKGATYKYVVFG